MTWAQLRERIDKMTAEQASRPVVVEAYDNDYGDYLFMINATASIGPYTVLKAENGADWSNDRTLRDPNEDITYPKDWPHGNPHED